MGERWGGSSPQARWVEGAPRTGEADAWREDEERWWSPPCGVEAAGEASMEEPPSTEIRRTWCVCGLSQVWRTGDEHSEPRTGDDATEPRWGGVGETSLSFRSFRSFELPTWRNLKEPVFVSAALPRVMSEEGEGWRSAGVQWCMSEEGEGCRSTVWRTGDEDPESRWEAVGEASVEEPAVESRCPGGVRWVSEVWRTGDADAEPWWEATGEVWLEAASERWLKWEESMWVWQSVPSTASEVSKVWTYSCVLVSRSRSALRAASGEEMPPVSASLCSALLKCRSTAGGGAGTSRTGT